MPEPGIDWSAHLRSRLARLQLNPARETEIVEELSQHLDARYEELRAAGIGDAQAQRLALDELREPEALANHMRSLRQAHVPPPIAAGTPARFRPGVFWQDLRYAVRMLRKDPGFTVAAVLTLALGIGANSAIFALVDATLLRPLPFPSAGRLVAVWERSATSQRGRVSPRNLVDWNERTKAFDIIGAYTPNVGSMVLVTPDGTADTIPRQWVSAGIFEALGVPAVAGRTFTQDDDWHRRNVVVLSEAFWRSRFNADPTIVGRVLQLDAGPWTVVGVVPQEAQIIGRASIWAIRPILRSSADARGFFALHAIGRLKPGVTMDAAVADMQAVTEGLAREFPTTNAGRGVTLDRLHDAVIGSELRGTSLLFVAVVGFVLLICCGNVANLLLTRATARRRELAIRAALGADRPRIVRQLLTESLLLSVIGAALGLAVGALMLRAAPAFIPEDLLSPAVRLTLNLRVVGFCAAAAVLVGVVFGLAPAWQATDASSASSLGAQSRTVTGRDGRLRHLLVVAEVATAVLLLVGAGLLLRTLLNVNTVDRGYGADSVLTMIVDPPYPAEESLRFYDTIEREVRTLPGVRDVGWATTLPMGRSYLGTVFFDIVGDPAFPESRRPTADLQIVSPTYFSTLDLPIVGGRGFDERDARGHTPVCLVNQAFVRRHLQGRSPIGLRVAMRQSQSTAGEPMVREIVGVVRQVKGRPDETDDLLQVYVPVQQLITGDIFMFVRPVSGPADALAPSIRAAFDRVDRDHRVSVRSVMTLEDVASEATARHRFRAVLVAAFAALALLLAMVGLFGVLAYAVQQRVREFGVRRALGATTADVVRLVGRSAAGLIAAGAVIGLALSLWAGRLLTTMLFGVEPQDPATLAFVLAVIALTAIAAIAGPTWRATRIDPAVALRAE